MTQLVAQTGDTALHVSRLGSSKDLVVVWVPSYTGQV